MWSGKTPVLMEVSCMCGAIFGEVNFNPLKQEPLSEASLFLLVYANTFKGIKIVEEKIQCLSCLSLVEVRPVWPTIYLPFGCIRSLKLSESPERDSMLSGTRLRASSIDLRSL